MAGVETILRRLGIELQFKTRLSCYSATGANAIRLALLASAGLWLGVHCMRLADQ